MCYSALVTQHVKKLGYKYQARIQGDLFEDLFKGRLEGSDAKIPRAMEACFLEKPESASDLRIAKAIRDFRKLEIEKSELELAKQTKPLADAERTLLTKVTKKAQNDQRIATDKIKTLNWKIENSSSTELSETDSRIYPGMYAPLILEKDGERKIQPFRYLLRPRGETSEFDREFNGAYNARRDRLAEVFWWKSVYGKNHGILPIQAFFENVSLHRFENRELKPGEEEKNLILRFQPEALDEMNVPCIWDRNEEDAFTLDSFALITDEPNPEVAAAGHDRTPVIMRDQNIDLWLKTAGKTLKDFEIVFEEKQPTFFEHSVAA